MLFSVFTIALAAKMATADLLSPLPITQHGAALQFQPLMDFDQDVCYQTTAIDSSGRINPGLRVTWGVDQCRDYSRLWHANTYSRERCNNYWCAYMYAYYSEKDMGWVGGHVHDWENVIVWTLHGQVFFVSWSAHGDYTTEHASTVRFNGSRPKMVVHKGGATTQSMRKATADDERIENHSGQWFTGHLVSMERIDQRLRNGLYAHDFGSAQLDLKPGRFCAALRKAAPWDAINNERFNPCPHGDGD